jgi:prevent-host-death family protein
MAQLQVGVRELKSRLSHYLRQVKAGQSVIITERGRPVGRIVPVAQTLEERLEAMAQAGLIAWSGKKLEPMSPLARVRGEGTVADLLVEERDRDSGSESQ